MKKIVSLFIILAALVAQGHAQQVQIDPVDWVSGPVTGSQTSPPMEGLCGVTCTITSLNGDGFFPSGGPSGISMPISSSTTYSVYRITFSSPVTNPGIFVTDLDTDESLEFINPTPPISVTTGGLMHNGNVVTTSTNNISGWVDWSGAVSEIRFILRRTNHTYVGIREIRYEGCYNTSSVSPIDEIAVEEEQTQWGPIDVYTFCSNAVFVDGSASQNECGYYLSVAEVTNLNPLSTAPNIYEGWASSTQQAPNTIDLVNNVVGSANFVPGQIYRMTLATGPCWETSNLFFTVESCECPEDLELEYDCTLGIVSIANLPNDVTVVSANWEYSDGQNPPLLLSWFGDVSTSKPASSGSGYYSVQLVYTLPNGTECTFSQTLTVDIVASDEECCKITGSMPTANWGSNINLQTTTSCGVWPIFCEQVQVRLASDGCEDEYFYGIQNFTVNPTCSAGTYLATVGPLPGAINPNTTVDVDQWVNLVDGQFYLFSFGLSTNGGFNDPNNIEHWHYYIFQYFDDCSQFYRLDVAGEDQDAVASKVYPNPAKDHITIETPESVPQRITIISIDGKQVRQESVTGTDLNAYNISDLTPGLYFIAIEFEDGRVEQHRFVRE